MMRIGIDIGGMSIKVGLVNERYEIVAKKVIPTLSDTHTPEETIKSMAETVAAILKENHMDTKDCEQIGIACPGTTDARTGVVLYSNNIRWENVPLISIMKNYIDLPMKLANDADAAALAEVLCGAAKGKTNAVLLTLGTGVGSGVVFDGKIFSGPLRGGCEIGHMVMEREGRACTCGRKGCFECYASATALMKTARAAAKKCPESLLYQWSEGKMENIDGKMIFDAQKQGDETAIEVVDEYEEYLSIGIANVINIFRPEVVILGGGVSAQKQYLTDALQEKVNEMCFGGAIGEVAKIVTSEVLNDAGIIGAAFL